MSSICGMGRAGLAALALSLAFLVSGCATAPVTPSALGLKRIVIAQPMGANDGLFINHPGSGADARPVYGAFCQALAAALEQKGYAVQDHCLRPNDEVIVAGSVFKVPALARGEADIILVPVVEIGYHAFTRFDRYTVTASGTFVLLDPWKRAVLGGHPGHVKVDTAGLSKYHTAEALMAELPAATAALTSAATELGTRMAQQVR